MDVVAIDRELVHADERRRAAIDQCIDPASDQMEAGIEASARAEGIAAADELQVHGNPSLVPAARRAAGQDSPVLMSRYAARQSVICITMRGIHV
jgi:hypothetical protein